MGRNRLTCGDFGGKNAQGEPCGIPSADGPCSRHADQVASVAAHHFNPGFAFQTPPFQRTKDSVCIVGFTEHRNIAEDLDRDEWEIWGLNELYRYMSPTMFDRWFEIHGRSYLEKDEDGKQHIEDLKRFPIPVYMQTVHEDIPASVRFPRDEIIEQLGSRYWTNCPAWMLGFAIAMGFKRIWLIGVDMAQDCLAPDTKVLRGDLKYVRADELRVGDEIIAFDEEPGDGTSVVATWTREQEEGGGTAVQARPRAARMWRKAKIEGMSTAKRPSYRIHFEDGTSVVASEGHMWLTYGSHEMKWKRTDELVTPQSRRPTRVVRGLPMWETDHSWEAGYLAAAFDGEGSLSQTPHRTGGTHGLKLSFAQRDNAMADRFRTEMALKGFEWSESWNGDTCNFNVKGGRPEILRLLGSIRPERLIENLDASVLGQCQRMDAVAVTEVEFLGEVETVGFTTSTGTMVVEGLLSHNSEYYTQRTCCEHWLGYARGAGIDVWVPEDSDLLKCVGLYGYDDEGSMLSRKLEKRLAWLHKKDNEHLSLMRRLDADYEEKKAKFLRAIHMLEGAMKEVGEMGEEADLDRMTELREQHEKAVHSIEAMEKEYQFKSQKLRDERNQLIGGINDVRYIQRSWLTKADSLDGGNIPSRAQRAADPALGIEVAPSGDTAESRTPSVGV